MKTQIVFFKLLPYILSRQNKKTIEKQNMPNNTICDQFIQIGICEVLFRSAAFSRVTPTG